MLRMDVARYLHPAVLVLVRFVVNPVCHLGKWRNFGGFFMLVSCLRGGSLQPAMLQEHLVDPIVSEVLRVHNTQDWLPIFWTILVRFDLNIRMLFQASVRTSASSA